MLELSPAHAECEYRMSFAGDTFNTAVYLSRLGNSVKYATRLGDDPYSSKIIQTMEMEGIQTDLVQIQSGSTPGLYVIENDSVGERRFNYWRSESPVRSMFSDPLNLNSVSVLYLSGVTLAITKEQQSGLKETLNQTGRTSRIVLDINYRASLWESRDIARQVYEAVLPYCHTVFSSEADDLELWAINRPRAAADFYRGFGIDEVVLKRGDHLAMVFSGASEVELAADPIVATDTTGAGDAFSAAYLSRRLSGAGFAAALAAAHQLAGRVVKQRGAIIPINCEQPGT